MKRCKHCTVGLFWACGADYCYQERQGLIEEAQQRAAQRGHTLTAFAKDKGLPLWRARCGDCGHEAVIRLDPAPHQADVDGLAVHAACPVPK